MGKFRIRVKLQGFELELDGDRGDIPAITAAVQHQLGALVTPPTTEHEAELEAPAGTVIDMTNGSKRRTPRRRSWSGKSGEVQGGGPIEFRHDSADLRHA